MRLGPDPRVGAAAPVRDRLAVESSMGIRVRPLEGREVEVSFTAEPDGSTRVDLEHRHFDRHGAGAPMLRAGVDSPEGWGGLLQMYVAIAAQTRSS